MRSTVSIALALLAALFGSSCSRAELQARDLGALEQLHVYDDVWLSSQPNLADLSLLRLAGIQTVIDLRGEDEDRGFDEAAQVEALGLEYVSLPIAAVDDMTTKRLRDIRASVALAKKPVLVHCASANRVGAIWYVYRRLGGGLSDADAALDEAHRVGLVSPDLEARVVEFVDNEFASKARRGPTTRDKRPTAAELEAMDGLSGLEDLGAGEPTPSESESESTLEPPSSEPESLPLADVDPSGQPR